MILSLVFDPYHALGKDGSQIKQVIAGNDIHRVLVLHSYHQTFQWTDSVHQGIEEALIGSTLRVELYVEYMDSKRYTVEPIFPFLKNLYKKKYSDLQLDAIITSDDNAFAFILRHSKELFPGVPIIFCGVNDLSKHRIQDKAGITGVVEQYDLQGTLDLILKVHPRVKHIAVITDNTSSGVINFQRFQETKGLYTDKLTFIELSKLTADQLQQALLNLPEQTAIVNLSFFKEPGGRTFTLRQGIELIVGNSRFPVYTTFDFMLNYGTLGGVVVSGSMQGRHAALLAIRVLGGEPVNLVPIMMKSPNVTMFDHGVMGRLGLKRENLPPDSVMLREPESFFNRFRPQILTGAFFIALQAFVILLLFITMMRCRHAQQAHKTSEEQIRKIIEASPIGICIVRNRKFAFVNSQYVKMFGYADAEEINERFVEELYAPEDRARMKQYAVDRVTGQPTPTLYDIKGCRKDGSIFDAEARVTLIHYLGQPSSLGFIVDCSKEKQLRNKLEQSNRLEAIGTLAGGIAHDFNNILTAIIGHAELATLESHGKGEVSDNLEQVVRAGQRAKDLVRQILTFSRRQERASDHFRVALIVKEVLQLLRASLPTTITINTAISSKAMIHGDASQMHQMLMNLFGNAGYAMRELGGILAIRMDECELSKRDADEHPELLVGKYLRLVISDTGPGIPKKIRERIFEPFFTTKVKGEGSGMGLAQVHGIVKDHGGCIDVAEHLPHGAKFTILLPINEGPLVGLEEQEGIRHGGDERILLVDDEVLVTNVTSTLLEKYGYQVTCCNDSREALLWFENDPQRFDLVLTDLTMPNLTGDKLALAIMDLRPGIPLILSTGYSDRINETQALELGFKAFIDKPMVTGQLLQTVRQVLNAAC